VLFITTVSVSQQKTFENEVHKISKRIERITTTQKDSLKQSVLNINERLEKGEITKTTAATLKNEVATYHARRIEVLVGAQERMLQLLVQDKTNGKIASSPLLDDEEDINSFSVGGKTFRFTVDDKNNNSKEKRKKKKTSRRTTSQFVFALGVNNALQDHKLSSLDHSEYQFWQSHFYEVGFTWKTRFSKEFSPLYFKYGMSFLWNNLRPKNNQQHIVNGNMTFLATRIDEILTESRLRHVQMNFPVHVEWDFSRNKRSNSVRIGMGGFVGFKLGTRQYLEYRDLDGVDVEEVQYDNFNMNTINYGLSAYAGYRSTSLYVKYDMNPLFKNTDTRNISIGVRLDLN
tara:strand:+ start:2968 stop:4002 length:1035 start_codon:yes stop_codon:yes gene_type:complete